VQYSSRRVPATKVTLLRLAVDRCPFYKHRLPQSIVSSRRLVLLSCHTPDPHRSRRAQKGGPLVSRLSGNFMVSLARGQGVGPPDGIIGSSATDLSRAGEASPVSVHESWHKIVDLCSVPLA
jgi:hypothetical protein